MLLPTSSASIYSQGMVFKMKEIIAHYNADRNNSVEQETLMRQERGRIGRTAPPVPFCRDKAPLCISEGVALSWSITSSVIVTGVKKACDHRCQ